MGELEKAREVADSRREMLALRPTLNRAQSRLRKVNQQMDMVRRSNLSGEEKRQRMDRLRAIKNQIQRALGEGGEGRRLALAHDEYAGKEQQGKDQRWKADHQQETGDGQKAYNGQALPITRHHDHGQQAEQTQAQDGGADRVDIHKASTTGRSIECEGLLPILLGASSYESLAL